jgi:hypothetical protein
VTDEASAPVQRPRRHWRPKWDRLTLLQWGAQWRGRQGSEMSSADVDRIGIERVVAVNTTGPYSPNSANVVLVVPVALLYLLEVVAWLAWQPIRLLLSIRSARRATGPGRADQDGTPLRTPVEAPRSPGSRTPPTG